MKLRAHSTYFSLSVTALFASAGCSDPSANESSSGDTAHTGSDGSDTSMATGTSSSTETTSQSGSTTGTTGMTQTGDASDVTGEDTGDSSGDTDLDHPFQNPPTLEPALVDGELGFALRLTTRRVDIEDPDGCFQHCLRNYVPKGASQVDSRPVGPTMRVPHDGAFRVALHNELYAPEISHNKDVSVDLNTTNLHTHGFHVSPEQDPDFAGTETPFWADNVLLHVCPETCYMPGSPDYPGDATCMMCDAQRPGGSKDSVGAFEYRFDISYDEEHEPGTFWYHAHSHGVTANHVANGMAGAIIVDSPMDSTLCQLAGHGPEVCDEPERTGFERIFVFQQIPYQIYGNSCGNTQLNCVEGSSSNPPDYTINDVDPFPAGGTPPPRTLVNGSAEPLLVMKMNTLERWRLIHAGVRQNLAVEITPVDPFTGECIVDTATAVPVERIALDGLFLDGTYSASRAELVPGNRMDLLVQLSTPGNYCLWDAEQAALQGDDLDEEASIVARIRVLDEGPLMAQDSSEIDRLLAEYRSSEARKPLTCDTQGDPDRTMKYSSSGDGSDEPYCGDPAYNVTSINGLRLAHGVVDQCMPVEHVEAWDLTSRFVNHPFHIHVNPFTVCDPDYTGCTGDAICDTVGSHWRDTYLLTNTGGDTVAPVTRIEQRYQTYEGKFVQHCHILPHEDEGMMQILEIFGESACNERARCCPAGGSQDDAGNACCIRNASDGTASGETCSEDRECCSGHCVQSTQLCCAFIDAACSSGEDCCSGTCTNGTCAEP